MWLRDEGDDELTMALRLLFLPSAVSAFAWPLCFLCFFPVPLSFVQKKKLSLSFSFPALSLVPKTLSLVLPHPKKTTSPVAVAKGSIYRRRGSGLLLRVGSRGAEVGRLVGAGL